MNAVIFGGLACTLYLLSAGVQFVGLQKEIAAKRGIVFFSALVAILLHGLFNYQQIMTDAGINIGIFPMVSLISFAVAVLVILSSMRRPVENLLIVILPFAAVAILAALFREGSYTPRNDISNGIFAHIALSIIAYGLITIAAIQAALLSLGDYELKRHNLSVLRHIPPLQTMDTLLFELLWTGLVFLSLSIMSGFIFLNDIARPGLIHHTVITMTAWLVFSILLWGRHRWGWRGALASRWTLVGFAILLLGYFGSKLVLEIFLQRA